MENEELRSDDYISNLIRQTPLDSPADDFVDRVMAAIQAEPVVAPERKTFLSHMKSGLPFAALIIFCLLIFSTSDLPFLNGIPGKGYFMNEIMPYIGTLIASLKAAFASKYVTWGLLVAIAGGLLFLVDRFFSRRTAV